MDWRLSLIKFCSDKIKLYGTEIDLVTGKIKPDDSKVEGLKFWPVPRTKKELKSFLGSLIFFNQIAPLHGDDVCIDIQEMIFFVWLKKG